MLPFQTLDELIRWANERGMVVEEDNYGELIIRTGLTAVSSHGDLASFHPDDVA